MNALDIIVIVIVGASAFSGYRRGFVYELFDLAGWLAVFVALKTLSGPTAAALGRWVESPLLAALCALLLIVTVVLASAKLIARRLGQAARNSFVGPVDRVLGGGFGALKGLLGATILFLLVVLLTNLVTQAAYTGRDAQPRWLVTARTYPLLNATSRALVDFVDRRRNAPPPTDEELNR